MMQVLAQILNTAEALAAQQHCKTTLLHLLQVPYLYAGPYGNFTAVLRWLGSLATARSRACKRRQINLRLSLPQVCVTGQDSAALTHSLNRRREPPLAAAYMKTHQG